MKPRNPEVLLQWQKQNADTVSPAKMGPDETDTLEKALKAKYGAEPKRIPSAPKPKKWLGS